MLFAYICAMIKAGILGGGQLGRMLLQAAANYPVETYVMEKETDCPAAHLCHHFTQGDIKNFDEVYAFGKNLDALTIEIEHVNIEALEQLEAEGVKVYPKPQVIRTIKNKIQQKEYYKQHQIPSPAFVVTPNAAALQQHSDFLPAVHKLAEGGYDGRGVQLLRTAADMANGFDAPSVLEKMVEIQKEIAVIVAVDQKGDTALYPPVEMVFDPVLNLLDYQLCPADIPEKTLWKAEAIARTVAKNFNSAGLFAIELFINRNGDVLVNETAPRVHNSGHHTIEAHYSSQFDMLWRIMLGYPLGNTAQLQPSAMVNIIGAEGHSGTPIYNGMDEVLKRERLFVHLYGKKETRPGRKMGHITVLGNSRQDITFEAHRIKQVFSVTSA